MSSSIVLQTSSGTVYTSISTIRNAQAMRHHFTEALVMGSMDSEDVDWARLIDQMGYPEMLAAKELLKSFGVLHQADAIGSPGGIFYTDCFDIDQLISDLESGVV